MRYKRLRHIWNQLPSKIWWVYGLGSFPKLLFSIRRRKSFICTNVQVLVPIYSSCTRLHLAFVPIFVWFSQQPQFLVALVTELADATKSQIARMAAGLQLKNQLTSKDATVRLQYQQRWLSLDEGVKTHVKNMVRELQNCDDSSDRFHACLNVVFYVIDWVLLPVFVLQAVQTLGTEIARPAIAPQVKK